MKPYKKLLTLVVSLLLFSQSAIAQYPTKKIIGNDTVVIITEKQANDINNIFKNIKGDKIKFDSLVVSFDKAKKLNKELDAKQANYYSLLAESNNRTSIVEEKNKNLTLINTSLTRSRLSVDLSTLSFMFALVSVLAVSFKP
jgi:spore coat polysaccharide biosynthesis predicted glycosyltransferase SpsG